MAKISTYPIVSIPTLNDLLIGTDVENLNETKNFSIGDIGGLIGQGFVPYVGATGNVNLGAFSITAASFIIPGGLATQFVKADGSLDSTAYTPQTRTLTINGVTYNLSANRSWDLNTIDTLTTTGTSGAATYVGKTLNIPQYQAQGAYITQLSGEATAVGPGNATVTLSNSAVIGKILTGLNVTGGTVVSTDTILQAFGKVQNQINALAGGVEYQGVWNAATNTPFLQSSVGVQGHYYVVNVAGNTNLNGITDWQVGDWAIFNGSTWDKVDNTDAVVSVNGYVGAVVLTASDVGAVPTTRTLTINGVGYDLSADRSWTVGDVRTDQTYANPSWITSLAWTKITGTPTTLAGYGITDGALNTTTLTINGVTFDLTANRTWNVGTVTSIATTGPLTGGTITGSGTIGITQSSSTVDGYLSSTDWNAFNNKQEVISVTAPLTFVAGVVGITQSGAATDGYLSSVDWNTFNNKVSGSGTPNTLPMWGSSTSLINSPLSYAADTFNFQYNSATGGTVNFTNIGLTTYTYSIQMNNFGSPRSTIHSYTDGLVIQSIGGTQVSRIFANGNMILGTGTVETGHKLTISGDLFVNTIINAITDTDRFIVSDGGIIKYRTGAEVLADIGAQGSLTLTTTGTSGASTLIGNTLNIPQYTDQFVGTVTSVGLSMPSAFSVSNSPITSSGTIAVTGAGTASQYVRGDGTLADFPSGGGGGGSSVSYYLNGSVNQGTFVGNTYYEMNKTPIFGAGTDFSIAADGYIAQFITDAGDPNSLLIPAGNWNFETYFNASSSGGTPSFYVELYKYDGTTFTLIASNSANPEFIAFGTIVNPYFSALAVPETILTITDRLAVRIYVVTSGKTITLHTENSNLCQVITTFSRGLTALNGLTEQVQYFQVGTSGTDFNIASATATHTFNLPTASAVNRGALSSADWAIFNGKQNAITLTTTGTSGVSTLVGSTLNIPNYTTDLSGYVTLDTTQTITGFKTILRGGDVLNFKIGTDTLYGLKVAYNQNELVPSGEATWSFVNTFNRNGTGYETTPISFFRGVLVTGQRLLSASVNTNLLDYYGNNPSGRYPIYAYNTGVQQFASSIIVGETTGVVDAITGAIADLPAGVVANFKGRVIGSNAVNNNEFATLGQVTSTSRAAISLTTTGTSGPATYSSVTGVLNIPEYQGGVTSFNTRTGAVTLTSSDVTTALGYTPVTDARTLSINGVTYDLTANRSWTVGVNPSAREIQTYIATALQTTFTVTGGYTVGLVDVFINGVRLTSSDYTATNGTTVVLAVGTMAGNIVDIIKYTSGIVNSISGSGTTNYLPKFTGSTTIGDSVIQESSSNIGISRTPSSGFKLDIQGSGGLRILDNDVLRSIVITPPVSGSKGVISTASSEGISLQSTNAAGFVTIDTAGAEQFRLSSTGALTLTNLSGSGTRMVVADSSGVLSTQAIGSGAITGTGSTNFLPKFTGSTTIGNSLFTDNGTNGAFGGANYSSGTDLRSFNISAPLYAGLAFWANNVLTGDIFGYSVTGNLLINADPTNVFSGTKIGLGIDGTERFAIFSNGNVSIANSPTDAGYKLDVNGTGRFSGQTSVLYNGYDSNVEGLRLGFDTSYYNAISATFSSAAANNKMNFVVSSGNGTRGIAMTLQGNGNVGIGTSSPTNLITLQKLGSTSTTPGIDFRGTLSIGGIYDNLDYNSGRIYAKFDSDSYASARVTIAYPTGVGTFADGLSVKNGNVGIGTVSPLYTLHAKAAAGSTTGLRLESSGGTTNFDILASEGDGNAYLYQRSNYGILIGTNNSLRMTITSGGFVGIGTTPSYLLHIPQNNNLFLSNLFLTGTANNPRLSSGATGGSMSLEGGGAAEGKIYLQGAGSGGDGYIQFFAGGAERMRITSGGNVLIGTTSDNGNKLQVNGNANIVGGLSATANMTLNYPGANGISDGPFYRYVNSTNSYQILKQLNANSDEDTWTIRGGGWNKVGNLNASTGVYTALSDRNKKKDFEESTIGLNAILGLKPTLYRMLGEDESVKKQLGFIAQEVKDYIPQACVEQDNFIGLQDRPIIAALVKAIQELQAKLDKNNIN